MRFRNTHCCEGHSIKSKLKTEECGGRACVCVPYGRVPQTNYAHKSSHFRLGLCRSFYWIHSPHRPSTNCSFFCLFSAEHYGRRRMDELMKMSEIHFEINKFHFLFVCSSLNRRRKFTERTRSTSIIQFATERPLAWSQERKPHKLFSKQIENSDFPSKKSLESAISISEN